MLHVKTITFNDSGYPPLLSEIQNPPKQLYYLGNLPELLTRPRLAVVGSRKVTPYGKIITNKLAGKAAEQGIVIVSGLALGVDALAHQAALDAGGKTIAVLPSGLDKFYPATNQQLAGQILAKGGAVISEYPFKTEPLRGNFIARNRIISGISDGVLITEAAIKSGSLHTANFAAEQGRVVMAVPGPITSEFSGGTNNLIKLGKAYPITEPADIMQALGLQRVQQALPIGANDEESVILQLLQTGISDGGDLLAQSELDTPIFHQTITMLELSGKVRSVGSGQWSIA